MNNEKANKKIKRIFNGVVISNKMNKTIVVRVDSNKINEKYKKYYTISKTYKVHNPEGKYKVNDKVKFIECRPLSKDKRWRVLNQ